MNKSLNLYWFNKRPNVGDAASSLIVSSIFGFHVKFREPRLSLREGIKIMKERFVLTHRMEWEYVFPFQRCLMAIGSILDYSNAKCDIWGTGFREYDSVYKGGKVFAVRGYLTRNLLPSKYQDVPVGDPALLLPLVIKMRKIPQNPKEPRIALIPHYCDIDALSRKYANFYDILDVRTNDVKGFISRLCQYDYILSSSLHGVIISHAYGIPAIWVYQGYINSGSFKFHDYFSSVEIPVYEGFKNIDEILRDQESWMDFFEEHKSISLPHIDIKLIQKNILSVFPYEFSNKIVVDNI